VKWAFGIEFSALLRENEAENDNFTLKTHFGTVKNTANDLKGAESNFKTI